MPHLSEFAEEMSNEISATGAVSVSVAVSARGEVVDAAAWGERKAGTVELVTTDTLYQAASISKPVAAFAALRLVDQGRLDLNADVNDLLKSWKLPGVEGWEPRVTVRHLLSHAGGLSVHGFPGYPYGSPIPTLADVLNGTGRSNTPPVRVENIPGLSHRYSGGGYTILQQLMVDITGQPFPSLMEGTVLGPAGMKSATYQQPLPEVLIPVAATAHVTATPLESGFHVYPEMAAAGMWCTPTDLVRFAICVQRSIAGAPKALLSQELALEMVRTQLPGWGLGLLLQGEDPNRRFGHSGGNEGFLSDMAGYVGGAFAYAVMTNSFAGGPLVFLARNRVAELWDWPGYEEAPIPKGQESQILGYLGEYVTDEGAQLQITRQGEGLELVGPGQAPLHLDFVSEASALVREVRVEINFDLGDGVPTALTLHQHGRAIRAEKSPRP